MQKAVLDRPPLLYGLFVQDVQLYLAKDSGPRIYIKRFVYVWQLLSVFNGDGVTGLEVGEESEGAIFFGYIKYSSPVGQMVGADESFI